MQKIILDCDLMHFPNSGLYHYCLNLGNEVTKLLRNEAYPIDYRYYVPEAEVKSFDYPKNCIVEQKKLHKFIRPFLRNCKIWHAPFQSGRILPKSRWNGIKVLLTIHDLNALHEEKSLEDRLNSIKHTQRLIDRSEAIVCISEFTKQDVLKHCDVGNRKIYVIRNGTHRVSEVVAKIQPPSNRPFLFGLGYVNAKKNYHVLLPLLKKNEDIDLVIAGKLDELDYIDGIYRQAEKMKVADRLYLTGPVSEEEKSWYYRNCLAFVHPSLAEGFGAPVVEAMKFGKPLFLSRRTSLPEIGGDAAFYFSSFEDEHMQEIFKCGMQQFHQHNMSELVKQRGMSFDWKISATKYLEVYKSLL